MDVGPEPALPFFPAPATLYRSGELPLDVSVGEPAFEPGVLGGWGNAAMLTDRQRGLSAFAAGTGDRGVPETERGDAMPEPGCDGRGDEGGRSLDGLGDVARGRLDAAEGDFNLEDGPSPVGVLVANREGCGRADGVAMVSLMLAVCETWGFGGFCSVETGPERGRGSGATRQHAERDVYARDSMDAAMIWSVQV